MFERTTGVCRRREQCDKQAKCPACTPVLVAILQYCNIAILQYCQYCHIAIQQKTGPHLYRLLLLYRLLITVHTMTSLLCPFLLSSVLPVLINKSISIAILP